MLKNTNADYGTVAKAFHWSIALIIMALLLVGLYMTGLDRSPLRSDLYGWHKSFGILVLSLAVIRIFWKFTNIKPALLATHAKWEKLLAKLAHLLLYISMIGMPLSGWLMSSAGGHAVKFFGIQIPALITKNPEIGKLMHEVHAILGYVLIATILLHAAGAFKHHFIDQDITLKRMMAKPLQGFGAYISIGLVGVFAIGAAYFILLN